MKRAMLCLAASAVLLCVPLTHAQPGYTIIHSFNGPTADGAYPMGNLISDGNMFYGMTRWGGGSYNGTIFAVNSDGSGFTLLHSFSYGDGSDPYGSLLLSGGKLYGMTRSGGASGAGVIFSLNSFPRRPTGAAMRSSTTSAIPRYSPSLTDACHGAEA